MTVFSPEQEARLAELIAAGIDRRERRDRMMQVLGNPVERSSAPGCMVAWLLIIASADAESAPVAMANEHLAALGYPPCDRRPILMALWPREHEAIAKAMATPRAAYLDTLKMTGAERAARLAFPPAGMPPVAPLADVLGYIAGARTAPIDAGATPAGGRSPQY